MARSKSLAANQILQGLQKKDPRLYDLINLIVDDIDDIAPKPRTLSKSTTGGIPADVDAETIAWYRIKKFSSIRV